jgi:purine-binding chemotaxis protein CheW
MLKRKRDRKDTEQLAQEVLQIVAFRVAGELYGLDITSVREIDRMHPITKVPRALPFVEGVIHLRDMIIPVIDLAKRFGLPAITPERHTRIIITRVQGQSVGLIVNQVTEVIPIPVKSIGPAPPLTFDQQHRYVSGMARVDDGLISILNLDRLLSTEEAAALQQQHLF